ncbi:PKD domain-containing protein, partial [Candidatus Pacearchaeota archaeon]|nr:PKD domain-containing protein [Candidatus Pacearchaeota archaeon]
GTRQASCDLPAPLNQGGEISCSLNFDIYTTDYYYVCLRATQNTNYNTTTEDVNPCGFYGVPPGPDVKHDYNIFARAAKYDKIEKFSYNQQEYARQGNTGELKNEVLGYLDARYGKNCAKNCTIPVKFKAYGNFNIVVSNLSLTYSTIGNPPYTERMIYDATEQQAKISSGFKNLDLSYSDINLSGSGNKTLDLFLGDIKILSKVINFAKIPIIYSILPSTVSAGVPVKLVAFVSPPANRSITEYKWDFDGNVQVTSANSIVHTFNSVGANSVKLSVKDSTGAEASKEFTIIAGNPKQLANETLKKYRGRINNITREIETYPGWYKEYIEREIDIENLEFELASLERKFTVASSDEDFSGIMLNLSSMNIPRSIARGNDNSFFLLFDAEDINLERLDELDAGSCENGSEENYKEAILKWYNLNKASIEYFTISAYYDNEIRKVVTYFKIKKDGENYFIVNKNQGDVIINSDKAEDFDDSAGVVFENETEFIVLGEINPVEIIAYLSPEFRQLEISASSDCNYNGKCEEGENSSNCRNDCKPIGRIILYIIILIVAAVVIYIIMEEWYRRKYENYLFKNRNDLFNLVNFIVNAQHKGISNSEIEKRLGNLGWNS